MALTGTGDALGDAFKIAIDEVTDPTDRTELFRAMGNAVIDHIIANGAAAITISSQPVVVTSVSGVLTGAAVSGPGTGTVTGVGDLV